MPTIYLSPSLQEFNQYTGGGNEEYYMNLLADAMVPYLRASGIQFVRNNPEQTLSQVISESNQGNYDLHLALHSNAAPPALSGKIQGTDVYYYPGSAKSERAAELIAQAMRTVYPNPSAVKTVPTTSLGEIRRTRAPSVLIEAAYHDNPQDANWIRENLDSIAAAIVRALTEYFDIPFVEPQPARQGTVATQSGPLNIRQKPSTSAPVLAQAPKGAALTILGTFQDWYVVNYNGNIGYASRQYISG